jgi:UDP-glucose 4-epimerase
MKIFVTGGTGFIGSHFIRTAIAAGNQITAIHRSRSMQLPADARWVAADLDQVPLPSLENQDVLVHFAAHGSNDPQNASWQDSFLCNVTHSLRLWENAHAAGIKRFVICGSCFEYGSSGERYDFIPTDAPLLPTAAYHASKAAATVAALAFAVDKNVELMILRPFHVFGEGEASHRFWPSLKRAAENGEDFLMSDGQQIRDFVPVDQIASSFLNACQRQDINRGKPVVENLGSGVPRSLLDFAQQEWRRFGAVGKLRPGLKPQRPNEIMRYVPLLSL